MPSQLPSLPRLRHLGFVVVAVTLAAGEAQAAPPLNWGTAECDVILAAAPEASRQLATGDDATALISENAESILKQLSSLPLGLTDDELKDLRTQAAGHKFTPYMPSCPHPTIPRLVLDGGTRSAFTQPLFTADGRTAVVAWTLAERDRGQGWICVVRSVDSAWSATCIQTIVWAR